MLFTACSLVAGVVPVAGGRADQASTAAAPSGPGTQYAQGTTTPPASSTVEPRTGTPGQAIPPDVRGGTESIIVKAQRRLLKEKNSPSAVTELGQQQIAQTGVGGSTATLLRQAPSVYVYQQGLGDNAPEFTIRGLRGLEIATTLDDVPTQDLLAPGSFYLSNNLGAVFTLSQISGVSVYPGVAYPDKNTFGTIGGTIAYQSKRPTDNFYLDVTGSIGSFGTYKEGFELNSGSLDGPLGSGDNAPRLLLQYNNLQTQGFIDGTPNRENEMLFAFDKPFDDGLSKLQATVIYNTAVGLIENEPVPVPYLDKNGQFSNYPTDLDFAKQSNDNLLIILRGDKYVNDNLTVSLTGFYRHNDNQLEDYGALELSQPGTTPNILTAGTAGPFINTPAGFGEGSYFGPGNLFYGVPGETYNPIALYPTGSKYCPAAYVAVWGGRANAPCGLNDQVSITANDTYGIQPRVTILPPDFYGISNTIKIGGLVAKETQPTSQQYLGPVAGGSIDAANAGSNPGASQFLGGVQRTIYQGFIQDKIDLIDNTLHITPGLTIEGTASSYVNPLAFGTTALSPVFHGIPASPGDFYGYYKSNKWDRDPLPFLNVSYDFDKIAPAAKGVSVYGSLGESALFAPTTDFGPNTAGPPPGASIVHLYEGGVRYNVSSVAASIDYFYQKVDRDFGFFEFQSGPQNGQSEYSNTGLRETKGFEANITWQVTPAIQLFANGSHLLAKYLASGSASDTVAEDQYGIAFKGTPETGIPDWVSTFGIDYNRKSTLYDNDILDARFSGTYTGHQYTSYDLQGNTYLNPAITYPGLLPLNYTGCTGVAATNTTGCPAYTRYNQIIGATTYDPHGGISPFAVFNLDLNYTLPTPYLPVIKHVVFDLNIQNLFNQFYYQYFYKQVSPTNCGTFTSGPFNGLPKNNYSCGAQYADDIPGQPFSVFFTVTARF
jgi:iron complex outermembrane receptor protein